MTISSKKVIFCLSIIILGALLPDGLFFYSQSPDSESQLSLTSEPAEDESITIILVGDIMLDRGVEYIIENKGKGDFKFPFLKIADYLKETDLLFGNLEGPISNKGEKVGSIYSFRAEPEAIEGLTYAGFDVLSLANNHALDYGREALEDCLARLSNKGISYVGAGFDEEEAFSPVIRQVKGIKIGFLAFTNLGPETWKAGERNSGIAWIDGPVSNLIKDAKEKADVLIVSLHAGEEYQETASQFQVDFAREAIGAGADLFAGHHPHVIQPNEKYKEGYIFYSLGNFIFDQSFSEETMRGQIVKITIKDSEIKSAIEKEVKINEYFQPSLIVDK